MALDEKFEHLHQDILKDTRPKWVKIKAKLREPDKAGLYFVLVATIIYFDPMISMFADIIFIVYSVYFVWIFFAKHTMPFKLPKSAGVIDENNITPGGGKGPAEGIMYIGNKQGDNEEVWFNNNDVKTHMLYLGTTGAGKTVGLKGISCNALCWGSGYVYIDGKADTDLWSTLSAFARRFGRDDDLLLMNYMTGNIGGRVPSNTLNPFSSGSASYITNMLVSLMPDSQGDNAMWKDRAVSLIGGIMPCLVWMRDNKNMPLSIGVIRTFLTLQAVIKLSRDESVPQHMRTSVKSYLEELPGYADSIFDDDGNENPQKGGGGAADTPRQQHGFLAMQFTRSMSSLGDDYGFIFDTQAADVDMTDVVLQRRLLIVLIPALEKSGDETANLGKIIVAALKGMMGATLGSTVEGSTATAIDNKPSNSPTPFISIFDEVGYYASAGMGVMAAQARSLGFCLIFAGQDLAAMEQRIKEETKSITANCNIKIFGKLEDPTQTKDFFEKTVGQAMVTEVSGFEGDQESKNAGIQTRARANYDELRNYTEGQAVCTFGKRVSEIQIYYADVGHAKAMRVHRFLPLPPPSEKTLASLLNVNTILKRFRDPKWDPDAEVIPDNDDIKALENGFAKGISKKIGLRASGALSITAVAKAHGLVENDAETSTEEVKKTAADESVEKKTESIAEPPSPEAPISWADLLGSDEDKKDDSAPKAEEVKPKETSEDTAKAKVTEEPPVEKGAMSWMDIMGAADDNASDSKDDKPEPAIKKEAPAPIVEPPESKVVEAEPVVAPVTSETASATSDILNWADVIGFNEDEDDKK